MKKYLKITKFSFYLAIGLIFLHLCVGQRKELNMFDLCTEKVSSNIHLSMWKTFGDPVVILYLNQIDGTNRPFGFNCCVSATSDNGILVDVIDVNLASDPISGSCIDKLTITTEVDKLSQCRQVETDVASPDQATDSLETLRRVKICLISILSKLSKINSQIYSTSLPFGFTIKLMAFANERHANDCTSIFHGFQCRNTNRCIPSTLMCDGQEDCYDGTDESQPICEQIPDSADTSFGISVQGAVTLAGICIIVFAIIAMCVWQCFIKLRPINEFLSNNNNNDRSTGEIRGIPMAVYTVPITNLSPSTSANVAVSASESRPESTSVVPRALIIEDLPPTYESLFGNKVDSCNSSV